MCLRYKSSNSIADSFHALFSILEKDLLRQLTVETFQLAIDPVTGKGQLTEERREMSYYHSRTRRRKEIDSLRQP